MDSKIIAGVVIGALIIGGGSFYGGMQYAGSMRSARFGGAAGQTFTAGARAGGAGRFAGGTGGVTIGSVISKDAESITVQLGGPGATSTSQGTGSKIVLYNGSTQIGKMTSGTPSDLAVGEMVTISGTQNSDGSVTAEMIQIRPAGTGGRGAQ